MIYNFNEFNSNEKMNFKEIITTIVLAGGIAFSKAYYDNSKDNANLSNQMVQEINNSKSITPKQQSIINKSIDLVIKDILSSDYNKEERNILVDSIKRTKIIVTKSFTDTTQRGYFTSFKDNDNQYSYLTLIMRDQPKYDNVIVFREDVFDTPDSLNVIKHEIYHYCDKLLKFPSSKNLKPFVDELMLTDMQHRMRKSALILRLSEEKFNKLSKEQKKIGYEGANTLINLRLSNYNYLTRNEEIYARYKVFKSYMKENGFDHINKETIAKLIEKKGPEYDNDDNIIGFLYIMNLNRLEEMSKLLK